MRADFHLSNLISTQAAKYGNRPAFYYRDDDTATWIPISWNEMDRQILLCGKALYDLGIRPGDKIGIFSQNMYEAVVADFANFEVQAVSVPMYATSTVEQIEYIINDAAIPLLFVGEQYQCDCAQQLLKRSPFLKHIVVLDSKVKIQPTEQGTVLYYSELMAMGEKSNSQPRVTTAKNASQEDLMSILYTSGTTGQPKGVTLHQYNYTEAIRIHEDRLAVVNDQDRALCFLPLTHVFERACDYYYMHRGVSIYINHLPAEIQRSMLEVRPTLMCSVPRFWEKVYAAIQEKINNSPRLMRSYFQWAITIGRERNLTYHRNGKHAPAPLATQYRLFAAPLFRKVKKAAGIENGKFFPTAGARLSDEINEFLHALGINICYGYGLTESTATVCCYLPENREYVIGSLGRIMPDVHVRISNEGEILLKGKTITAGYYNRPDANQEVFTADGWFRTGDAGYIDMENNLYLTDRIKDLFKTAGGKYIAPQTLEGLLCENRHIEQAVIIGNERKYVTALIVPEYSTLETYAKERGVVFQDRRELLSLPQTKELFDSVIAALNQKLPRYEQIKYYTLLPKPLTIEQGHLTNTLKLRRKVIYEIFAKEIEAMYPDK